MVGAPPKNRPFVNWWKVAVSRNQRTPTVALRFGSIVGGIAEQRVLLGIARIDEGEQQVARRDRRRAVPAPSTRSHAAACCPSRSHRRSTARVPENVEEKRTSCAKRRRSFSRVMGLAIGLAVPRKNCVTSVSSSVSKVLRSK